MYWCWQSTKKLHERLDPDHPVEPTWGPISSYFVLPTMPKHRMNAAGTQFFHIKMKYPTRTNWCLTWTLPTLKSLHNIASLTSTVHWWIGYPCNLIPFLRTEIPFHALSPWIIRALILSLNNPQNLTHADTFPFHHLIMFISWLKCDSHEIHKRDLAETEDQQ